VDGELVDSRCDGRVVVEAGARLERSTVRGPAIIGAGARLADCYVGPYTAVGENCVIERAEVEHSILLAGSSVRRLDGRMESSLLGRNVSIGRVDRQPRAFRFMVGDNSEIGIL
jgi:glucose-1-phosphate thymidylyltransferase